MNIFGIVSSITDWIGSAGTFIGAVGTFCAIIYAVKSTNKMISSSSSERAKFDLVGYRISLVQDLSGKTKQKVDEIQSLVQVNDELMAPAMTGMKAKPEEIQNQLKVMYREIDRLDKSQDFIPTMELFEQLVSFDTKIGKLSTPVAIGYTGGPTRDQVGINTVGFEKIRSDILLYRYKIRNAEGRIRNELIFKLTSSVLGLKKFLNDMQVTETKMLTNLLKELDDGKS